MEQVQHNIALKYTGKQKVSIKSQHIPGEMEQSTKNDARALKLSSRKNKNGQ